MSEFKKIVLDAKNKAHRKRFYYAFSLAIVGFFIIVFLLLSRGTLIEVLPDDIKKSVKITSASSLSFIIDDYLYSLMNQTTVNAQADGYKPKTQTLTQADFGKVTTITLEPLPSQLLLTSDPSEEDTRWLIDGNLVAVKKTLNKNLEAGDYKVGVSHPYFGQVNLSYSLKPGETIKQTISLPLLEGEFEVESQPEGAIVTINGEIRGETPFKTALQGGRFDVTLSKQGYDSIEDKVEVKVDALKPSRDYRLALRSAGILVSVFPLGGTLTLNGINVKSTAKIKQATKQK